VTAYILQQIKPINTAVAILQRASAFKHLAVILEDGVDLPARIQRGCRPAFALPLKFCDSQFFFAAVKA
jgi:hypothetical protein